MLTTAATAAAQPPPPVAFNDEEHAADGSVPAYVPPRLAPDPNDPVRPRWEDADAMAYVAAEGTVGMCETLARPLMLIPAFGATASLAAEWTCLLPAAIAVDYFQIFHGGRDLLLWESGTALLAAKLVRDVTRLPAVVSYTTAAMATVVVASLVAATGGAAQLPLEVPIEYQPIALTGFLTSQALLTMVLDALREVVVFYTYHGTLGALSEPGETREEEIAAQQEAWMPADLNVVTQLWAIGAIAGGSRPAFSVTHLIPVVGRVIWAIDAADTLKARLRRLSKDTLRDDKEDFTLVDASIYGLYAVDAGVAIVTDLVLLTGLSIWAVGTLTFLIGDALLPAQSVDLALLGLGTVGVALGSTALILVVVKDVKGAVAPWLLPLAYGLVSPSAEAKMKAFFADEEEEGPPEAPAATPSW